MQSFIDEMADQKLLRRIDDLEKDAESFGQRLDRIGTSSHESETAFNARIAKLEGHSTAFPWVAGIVLTTVGIIVAVVIAGGRELYLMNGRVGGIESNVAHISGTLDGIKLKQVADNPTDPKNIQEAKQVLNQAKASNVKIPANVVESEGKKFLDAVPSSNPDAWAVAMDFLSYRSFLNKLNVSLPEKTKENRINQQLESYHFSLNFEPLRNGKPGTLMLEGWTVMNPLLSKGNFARVEKLSQPQTGTTEAIQVILDANNSTVILDDQWLKHVILENAHVVYNGGPVRLEDVYFLNCTFSLLTDSQSQDLAQNILTSTAVSFSSGVGKTTASLSPLWKSN